MVTIMVQDALIFLKKWIDTYNKRINENKYIAYIKDNNINEFVGYVNYHSWKKFGKDVEGVLVKIKL